MRSFIGFAKDRDHTNDLVTFISWDVFCFILFQTHIKIINTGLETLIQNWDVGQYA